MGSSFAATCESRNHIFLIHGIGGSAKTFGAMDDYLQKINPCITAKNFEYDTGNSKLSTYHFSDDLNQFIEKSLVSESAGENDKISLIMHSQGGIVGSLWLHKVKTSRPDLYKKIDSFITLSTPYWGSTMAAVGDKFFFTLPEELDNPISPVGRTELVEMSYGSATIQTLQQNYASIFSDTHIRFLAIGGLKRNFNPTYGEDDTTVSVYSSSPDHYSVNESVDLSGNEVTAVHSFVKTNNVNFIPVTATHFPLEIPGVARIQDSCLVDDSCNHPAMGFIENHLHGVELPPVQKKYDFYKYRVHIYLTGWEGQIESKDDVVVSLIKPHGEKEDVDFDIKRGRVLSSSFSGILKKENVGEMTLTLKIKGKVVKTMKAPVEGGVSTFVNFNLRK